MGLIVEILWLKLLDLICWITGISIYRWMALAAVLLFALAIVSGWSRHEEQQVRKRKWPPVR